MGAAKKREFLRQRTIDAEKQLKTLQADQIAASNKFEPFEIQYEALKTNYDSEKKRQGGMSAAGAKLKERIKSLKNEMHLATTKEAKEKSSIDYQYFQNKLSTQKLESTEVDQNVKRLAPQVRESHVKLTSARSEYLQAVKDYREGKWQIAYDEARVKASAKEKLTKTYELELMEAKDAVFDATQANPVDKAKVDSAQEQELQASARVTAGKAVQNKYNDAVTKLQNKNKAKMEAQKALMKEKMN